MIGGDGSGRERRPGPEARPAPGEETGRFHAVTVDVEADRALTAVGEAAELWGGEWERSGSRGQLEVPLSAGLRHGWLWAEATTTPAEGGVEVVLTVERTRWWLWTPAVVILALALAGVVLTVAWPFVPELLPVAPFGALIALSAWFLIVTRLTHRGPEDLLELARDIAEAGGLEALEALAEQEAAREAGEGAIGKPKE